MLSSIDFVSGPEHRLQISCKERKPLYRGCSADKSNENFVITVIIFTFVLYFRTEVDILKKYAIPYKGLSTGKHRFEFEVDDRFFEAFENSEIKRGRARVEVELDRGSALLTLEVEIDGEVTVECDRCLEDCTLPVHYRGELVVRFSETQEEYDGEVMWLSPAETEVNLAQYIYESICLSLPYQRVHPTDENGRPTCNPEMLARFRIVTPEEFGRIEQEAAEHGAPNPEFEKLKALKDQME